MERMSKERLTMRIYSSEEEGGETQEREKNGVEEALGCQGLHMQEGERCARDRMN